MKNTKRFLALALAGVTACSSVMTGFSTEVQAADIYVTEADLEDNQTAAPEKDEVIPDANQYEYQKQELAAFCHFGPNTFNEIEWGEHYHEDPYNSDPKKIFTLTEDFDADTMVRTLKEAGFQKLIVTAKHHDGFCLWDSAYTTYDVAEAGYQDANGNSDILAEISEACTEYDMDMGLYLSPWDIHEPSYGYYDEEGNPITDTNLNLEQKEALDVLDYNEYYNNQLQEILGDNKYGNNGHFKEVWMDGAKGSGASAQEYDFVTWFETIQRNEGIEAGYDAECMLFGAEAYTTVRWIGNELGFAAEETWSKSKVDYTENTIDSNHIGEYTKGFEDGNKWTVPESDARITSGWFWGTTKATPKSVQQLAEMYFRSVGHNSPLLLNVPPNNQGFVDEAILNRVTEFGNNIRETFQINMAAAAEVSASEVRGRDIAYAPSKVLDGDDNTYWTVNDGTTEATLLVDLGSTKTFDVVSIEEAIQFGQRIKEFKIEYRNANGEWKTFDEGTTIGAKRLSRKSPVKADELRITVKTSTAVPMISEVGVYKASKEFEAGTGAPIGIDVIDERDAAFNFTGSWTDEGGEQFPIAQTGKWCNSGAGFTVNFTGSKIYLVGTKDPSHGTANVSIDGEEAVQINTSASSRALGQVIYASEDLTDGNHTLTLTATGTIGIDGAYVINNGGIGMIGIEKAEYTMNEDSEMMIKLVREGGTTGKATVILEPNPGSAIQDDYDTEGTTVVTFEEGEKEKEVVVITKRNTNETGDQYFTVELNSKNPDVILGMISRATINIIDEEGLPVVEKEYEYTRIPRSEISSVSTSSQEIREDKEYKPIDYAFDVAEDGVTGKTDTFWHANWDEPLGENANSGTKVDAVDVEVEFDQTKTIGKLSYLPRIEPLNGGVIGTCDIYVATTTIEVDGEQVPNYEKVCTATFDIPADAADYDYVTFDEPVEAKYLKLTATAMAEGGGNHTTASDIGIYEAVEKTTGTVTHTITATAGEGGTVAPVTGTLSEAGTIEVEEGKLKTFAFKPAEGKAVKNVIVNGESVGVVSRYTVLVTADTTISVEFEDLADYTKVDEAIAEAEALDRSKYTQASLDALQKVLDAVETGKGETEQATVDGYAAAIEAALEALVEIADYSAVNAAIEAAKAKNEADYTTKSWKALQDAIAAVVKEVPKTEQATVDGYAAAINAAIEALKEVVYIDPTDASCDIPTDQYSAEAGSTNPNHNPDLAFDNKYGQAEDSENTWWHTDWGQGNAPTRDQLYYQIELKEATEIEAVRYFPRYQGSNHGNGETNGYIGAYRVEVSNDGTTWTTAAEGTWAESQADLTGEWKIAVFDEPVTAKFVKLVGVETFSNGNNQTTDMAIAEIRIRAKEEYVAPVDKTALVAEIEAALIALAAGDLVETEYTEATWAVFEEALAAAQAVNAKGDASQEEVTKAAEELEKAIADLEKVTTPDPEPEQPKAGWIKDDNGWWYCNADGTWPANSWKQIGGEWYWFGADGYMKTGWLYSQGEWYYLKADGSMATGWIQVDSTWYYLNASGAMETGWIQLGSVWYYLKADGSMATGWIQVDSTWYYLKADGSMATGWIQVGSTWYYLNASGAMVTGWLQQGSTWYYLKADGSMAVGKVQIAGRMNSFASNGAWLGYI